MCNATNCFGIDDTIYGGRFGQRPARDLQIPTPLYKIETSRVRSMMQDKVNTILKIGECFIGSHRRVS